MHNSSDNKLFDLIKSKFQSDESSDWNTPSDSIFEYAIEAMNNAKRKKRILWIKRTALFLLLLFVTSFGVYFNFKINKLQSDFAKLKDHNRATIAQVRDNKDLRESKNNHLEDSDLIPIIDADIQDDRSSSSPQNSGNSNIDKTISLSTLNSGNSGYDGNSYHKIDGKKNEDIVKLIDSENLTNIAKSQSVESLINESYGDINVKYSGYSRVQELQDIAVLNPSFLENESFAFAIKEDFDIKFIDKQKKIFSIGLILKENMSVMSMNNGLIVPNNSLTGFDNFDRGRGFAINFNKQLTRKLSVSSAIGINRINSKSVHSEFSSVDLDKYNVAENTYTLGMTVETPLGKYKSIIDLDMENNVLNINDIMYSSVEVGQTLNLLNLDLGLQYELNPEKNLTSYIGGGVSFNKVLSMNSISNTTVLMGNQKMQNINEVYEKPEGLNSYFFSLYLESGFKYKITDSSNILFTLGYNQSISSLTSDFTNNRLSVGLRQFNLGLGYSYQF